MNIQKLHQLFKESMLICTDTRAMKKNSLFFALTGDNFNGNEYAKQALENGAKYAVIDQEEFKLDDRYILVENVLSTLQKLANFHRKQLNCPVLGITGSNGKTTTKELVATVLGTQYKVAATKGNLNNDIGVPFTILSAPLDTEFLIVEMGANHKKEIKFLCEIAEIDFGIITNIGKAHLEGFGSFEGVIEAKKELYDYLSSNKGIAFVNQEDYILNNYNKELQKKFYGLSDKNNLKAKPFVSLYFEEKIINTQLIGDYNALNILAACTIGKHFNISVQNITTSISNYIPSNNRSQLVQTEQGNTIILDAYNANPSSMQIAINSFNNLESDSKLLILGDMLELGKDSLEEHQKIISQLKMDSKMEVILVGQEFSKCQHNFTQFNTAKEVSIWIQSNTITNTSVLLKGSRKIKLEQLKDSL
jgi:UDP-N-acetylmuramoyl-tripeptide--D-alanyl-D-alanine ligase